MKWGRISEKVACIAGQSPTDHMAEYTSKLIKMFGKNLPYFIISWFSLSHIDKNGVQSKDEVFRELLSLALNGRKGNPGNTLVILMSDHRYNYSPIRGTFLGFYEQNLPFFLMEIPESLKEVNPDWELRLRENSARLTTPFDLYQSLVKILGNAEKNSKFEQEENSNNSNETVKLGTFEKRGISLFGKIVEN